MAKRGRAYRRDIRKRQIARKKGICKRAYGFEWYLIDGLYDKGKIDCSCGLCKPSRRWKMPTVYEARKLYKMELDEKEVMGENSKHSQMMRKLRKALYFGAGI